MAQLTRLLLASLMGVLFAVVASIAPSPPSLSPAGPLQIAEETVFTLTTTTPGTNIMYSTDGHAPATGYVSPFTISTIGRIVLRAQAQTPQTGNSSGVARSEERAWAIFMQRECPFAVIGCCECGESRRPDEPVFGRVPTQLKPCSAVSCAAAAVKSSGTAVSGICEVPRVLTGAEAASQGAFPQTAEGLGDLQAAFLPRRPGAYRVDISADDGCRVFRDSVVVDVRCPAELASNGNGTPLAFPGPPKLPSSFNGRSFCCSS